MPNLVGLGLTPPSSRRNIVQSVKVHGLGPQNLDRVDLFGPPYPCGLDDRQICLAGSEGRFSGVDELQQQTADFLGLFLLNPMSGTIDEVRAAPLSAGRGLHPLNCTG